MSADYFGPWEEHDVRVVVRFRARTKLCRDYEHDQESADAVGQARRDIEQILNSPKVTKISNPGSQVAWTGVVSIDYNENGNRD